MHKILVVEDEPVIALILVHCIFNAVNNHVYSSFFEGNETTTAYKTRMYEFPRINLSIINVTKAPDAIKLLEEGTYDAVTLDYNLDNNTFGIEVVDYLVNAHRSLKEIVIISTQKDFIAKAQEVGIIHFFHKGNGGQLTDLQAVGARIEEIITHIP